MKNTREFLQSPTRREFIRNWLAASLPLVRLSYSERIGAADQGTRLVQPCGPDPLAGWKLQGTVPFDEPGDAIRFGTLEGSGLDARLLTDLSLLSPQTLVTPTEQFYIRTAYPDLLDPPDPWVISINGLVRRPVTVPLPALVSDARPLGTFLMECAGNSQAGRFGLMSAATWSGVPMMDVLARVELLPAATRVLVSGYDGHSGSPLTSVAGASWIFTLEQLRSSGAFLATEMNGQPLTKDHGYPIRLFVPRWYGACCIKWVNEITLVDDEAPATTQMREFATRTFQSGQPGLAREYKPASLDLAAMPIRIEQWRRDGRVAYRIVGVVWGGTEPADSLQIRFNPGQQYAPVTVCPAPTTNDTWTPWSHVWKPGERGRYRIVLNAADPSIRTERLDVYFYAREVVIDEI